MGDTDDIDETQDDVQEANEGNTEAPDTGQTDSDTGLDTNGIDCVHAECASRKWRNL